MDFLLSIFSAKVIVSLCVVVVIIIAWLSIKHAKNRFRDKPRKHNTEKVTAAFVLFDIAKFIVLLIGVLTILQINEINVSGLIAGLGIISAIVGLALQDFIKDIIMGVNILTDHFFSVGECVEYNGQEGLIVGMTLRTTKIGNLEDHSITTVCNRNITQIHRLSDRFDIDIPLSYNEKFENVSRVFETICKNICKTENVENCVFKGIQSFEASSINYRIQIFCNPKNKADIRRAAFKEINLALNEAGISIPFNQLDVHCDMSGKNLE